MQKLFFFLTALTLVAVMAGSPVLAGGDKNHGEVGQGEVDQGGIGSSEGNAPGNNAQGNMVYP